MQFTPPASRALARIGNRSAFFIGPDAFLRAKGGTDAAALAPAAEYVDIELLLAVRLPAFSGRGLFGPLLVAFARPGHFGLIFDVFHRILE